MAICTKCGKRLLKTERGNIRSSSEGTNGFEHKDCSIAKDMSVVSVTEQPQPSFTEFKKPEVRRYVFTPEDTSEEKENDEKVEGSET